MTTPVPPVGSATGIRGRMRILVIDDAADHRLLIERRLSSAGMQVRTAANAFEGLERLDDVDLVLLDYRLPGMSGLDALRAIRDRPHPPSVIMVTGAGTTQVAVDAMRAGAINFVVKDRGYLEALPEVVERAWHHHDLSARTAELQRLALLVTSATDRDGLHDGIVEGAATLLRADASALLLEQEARLVPVATFGRDHGDALATLAGPARAALERDQPWMVSDCLVVPLPREEGGPASLLLVWPDDGEVTAEERQVARVFASFAGIALRNLRRVELERLLVSELQQTLDARQDFIASISHELRTPLTAITGFAATLTGYWDALDDERRQELLGRIERNADDLALLVDELLELADLERGRSAPPHLESIDLREHVGLTLGQLEHLLAAREVKVDVPAVPVLADTTLLRRTLGNLLSNAVKYSEVGTGIDVVAEMRPDEVRVAVVDRGIGLPDWEASRVFEPFFRARSSVTNAVRGSGIGLALVREYVQSMGGQVTVETTFGEGSTFAFTLQRAPGPGGRRDPA
jgi:signal transduction histidine kinase